jgi:hypothetical protein
LAAIGTVSLPAAAATNTFNLENEDDCGRILITLESTLKKIGSKYHHRIYWTIPYHARYSLIVALHKNWGLEKERVDDDDVEEAIL